MIIKVRVVFILAVLIGCAVTHVYAAKDDGGQAVLATLHFKMNSAEINPEFENDLKKIMSALAADPAMGLRIEGHGYPQSASSKNHNVSQKRVQTVKEWFLKQGIDKSRLKTKSFADDNSVALKTGDEKTARRERVEIFRISLKQPLAVLQTALYQFDPVVEGQEVVHEFIVQNKGSATLEIKRVKTD